VIIFPLDEKIKVVSYEAIGWEGKLAQIRSCQWASMLVHV